MNHKSIYIIGLWVLLAVAYVIVMHPGRAAAACAAVDTSRGQVTSTFTVPSNGTYRVWSRIQAPDTTNNSYILQIDSTAAGATCGVVVGDSAIPANTWTWVDYQNGTSTSKVNVTLTAGQHTLTMIGREDNVQLDRVIFTTDIACVPTGTGDNCANPPDTTPPTVTITAPSAGANVQGTVTVQANASDDVALSKVEFYVDGNLKVTDTTSQYSYSFDTTTVSNASHTIMAKAYDTSNNVASSSVAVTVNNPAVCASGSKTLPTTPASLTKTASTYTSINFSWSASTPSPGCTITGYKIYRGGTLLTTLGNVTTFSDNGLSAGTSYNYNVQAVDSGSNTSAQSALASFSTNADNVAPGIPANFVANAGSTSNVSLTWTASTDNPNPGGVGVSGYNIYRNGSSAPTYTVNSATTTTYTDTNVVSSTKYTYTITAFDKNNNESAPSSSVSATTPAPTCSGTPSVPSSLHSTSQSLTSVTLAWSASTASTGCTLAGYHVYRGGAYVGDSNGTGLTYSDTGLSINSSYNYTVAAFDTGGHVSAQSAVTKVATLADTSNPSVPGSVTATAVSSSQVTVSWTAATDNVGIGNYRIYRGGTLLATVASNKSSYSDTSVSANTNYSYQVSAVDTSNNEGTKVTATPNPVHTPASVDTTAPSQPQVPANPTPVIAPQSVQLNWTPSSDNVGVIGYHVKINGVLDTFDGDATTPTITAQCLAPNVQYTFTIIAFDAAGNNSAPTTISARTLSGGLVGDFDCSHAVNNRDFSILSTGWAGTRSGLFFLPTGGDADGNTVVNNADFSALSTNWGKTIP